MSKTFKRRQEDFVCEQCGLAVRGNGYTNHCPHCLWSKHVDLNPGDRLADCHGLMEPERIELKRGAYIIHHRCLECGHLKPNQASPADDIAVIC